MVRETGERQTLYGIRVQLLTIGIILSVGFAGFMSGRIRHDLVAIFMLLAAIASGLVSPGLAFTGFADPVVTTVAAVMVVSASIARSGILRLALAPFKNTLVSEIGIAATFSILCGVASAFMNNIGALALLLPAAIGACRTASVSPSRVLMPMAFASLLGGLVTLIGTPPNVIIADTRALYAGAPFQMFDFAPVGVILAIAGIGITLASMRFLPALAPAGGEPLLFRVADYLFELRVLEKARQTSLKVGDLRHSGKDGDEISVHAIDRGGMVFTAPSDWRPLLAGDIIQIETRAPKAQILAETLGLEFVGGDEDDALEAAIMECVVSERSPLIAASDARKQLSQAGAALLAVSKSGRALVKSLDQIRFVSGDVLLLQAQESLKPEIVEKFALLPLAERPIAIGSLKADWRPVAILAAAVASSAAGIAPLSVTLLGAVGLLAILGRVNQKAYQDVDWSIIVLLGAIIPVAQSFSNVGGGTAVAQWLASFGSSASQPLIIGGALAATMLVTPFLNNAAAVLIMAPIAASLGQSTGVRVDAMLMAVAVGASCDFLTPFGHQSNTLVMGPGGYRFLDYTRLGAPLTLMVLFLGTVLIQYFWS